MSRDLDQAIHFIQECTTPDQIVDELVPFLRKLDKSSKATGRASSLLEGALSDGRDPLSLLDPASMSAGFLFVLNARLSVVEQDLDVLLPFVDAFVSVFDVRQARVVSDQVSFFARQLSQTAQLQGKTRAIVEPLDRLIQRFAPPGFLTNLHPIFLQAVLASRLYAQAHTILSYDISDFDSNFGSLKYQDHLLYHYYGGVILALLGDYSRAADLLEICVSAPGPGVSAIQVDAHKKLVLLQLLVHGKMQALPKYTSPAVSTACKNLAGSYIEYAVAYGMLDQSGMRQCGEKYREQFEKDYNIGLLELCEKAFRRRTIQKLTETFITQSLIEIAKAVGVEPTQANLSDLELEVVDMINAGEIFGSISHGSSPTGATDWDNVSVTFTDDPEPYNSHRTVERVARAIAAAAEFENTLAFNGMATARSKDFVQKAHAALGSGASGQVAMGGGEDLYGAEYGVGYDDEDDIV